MKLLLVFVLPFLFFAKGPVSHKTNLHYLFRAPIKPSKKPPLLILLHGIGSNEEDLFSFANQLPPEYLVVSVRAPYSYGQNGYAWYNVNFSSPKPIINKEEELKSRKELLQFMSQLYSEHSYDTSSVYLCGFSQGAIMSLSLGLTHPEKIKGVAIMSGRLLDEVKPQIGANKQLSKLKVFISHGTEDKVLPITNARESKAFLIEQGITPSYKEYSGAHTITPEMLSDLIKWLIKS